MLNLLSLSYNDSEFKIYNPPPEPLFSQLLNVLFINYADFPITNPTVPSSFPVTVSKIEFYILIF